MAQLSILTVCTANICRSPASAALLDRALTARLPALRVASAGTAAQDGNCACDLSAALVGEFVATSYPTGPVADNLSTHRSRRVSPNDVAEADLVLALDRSHRSALAQLCPGSRARTFTLRQAATIGAGVAAALSSGSLPEGAPPLPEGDPARFRWWVGELDAGRASAQPTPETGPQRLVFDSLDVPDPHVIGYQYHPMAVELIESAVAQLAQSLIAALDFSHHAR